MQNLGLQDWKIFRNYSAGELQLQSCLLLHCQKAKTYLLLGQIDLETLHFSKANTLYLAFISETMQLNVESTVFAHEGRHAIDQLYFKAQFDSMPQDERELRAKYSEVIFSSRPKLALTGSILGGDLDSNTIHGKANLRLRIIIVQWMQQHRNEISHLNDSIPLLMQLNLLTDQQLREICLEADPLSGKFSPTP